MRYVYNILIGKLQGKRLLGRPRRRWEHNIIIVVNGIWMLMLNGFNSLRTGTSGGLL
jgi:hypothetical protein